MSSTPVANPVDTDRNQARPLILHVVHRFDVGGLENGVVNLVNRMSPSWSHAILALTEVSESFARRIERNDVQMISLRKAQGHLIGQYPRLYRLFKTLRPAIVHTRNLAALEASVPAWAAGVPVRIHGEHGWDVSDPHGAVRRYRVVRRLYRPFVNRYIALSRHIEDYLASAVGIDGDDISQIYNGVDTIKFRPSSDVRRPCPESPFQDTSLWTVGTVGRLQEVKDQMNLVRAFARALELAPEARARMRLVVVGDGAMREALEQAVNGLGIANLVWMPGSRSDVPDLLRSLDCFVLPSLSEGISNTILEAMACALPVIATKVGGNVELIEDGLSGRLVPAANSEALAHVILEYFRDGVLARRHGRTARRVVETRFSLDRMVSDYSGVYEQLLRARAGHLARGTVPVMDDSRQSS